MSGNGDHRASFQSKPIGETVMRTMNVHICRSCGYAIDEHGECDYGCGNDATDLIDRPSGSVVVRTWQRTDELIAEYAYDAEPKYRNECSTMTERFETLNYKGYSGSISWTPNGERFYGEILKIGEKVTYHASSLDKLRFAFMEAVDDYMHRTLAHERERFYVAHGE